MNKLFRIYFSPESNPTAGEPKPKEATQSEATVKDDKLKDQNANNNSIKK